jgi:hypothetical protein
MTNRQSRAPGRGIRRAGPIVGVLATVGIALGAWVGIASAAGSDAPETSPASVTEVETASGNAAANTDGDKNTPTVDATVKDKPKDGVEASPKVVSPGKPLNEKTAGAAPRKVTDGRQPDTANQKVGNGQGPQARAQGGGTVPKGERTAAPAPLEPTSKR